MPKNPIKTPKPNPKQNPNCFTQISPRCGQEDQKDIWVANLAKSRTSGKLPSY